MPALKEKFPTKGDCITLEFQERSQHSKEPLMYEVVVLVTSSYPEDSLLIGTEMDRFCYVKGYRFKARKLPTVNPYGNPGTNGYLLNGDNWQIVTVPS